MRQHENLPAMVGLMSKHVAQHFNPNRKRRSQTISAKRLHAPCGTERLSQHLPAASRALGQSRAGLFRRAMRPVELRRNPQMRRRKPDPLRADIVHMREDRRNRPDLARRFGFPGSRVEMLDQNLVHAIIGRKDLDRGPVKSSMSLAWTRAHSFPLLNPIVRLVGYDWARWPSRGRPSPHSAAQPYPDRKQRL